MAEVAAPILLVDAESVLALLTICATISIFFAFPYRYRYAQAAPWNFDAQFAVDNISFLEFRCVRVAFACCICLLHLPVAFAFCIGICICTK